MSLAEAVGVLEPTSAIVLPPGAGGATAIEREIGRQADRLRGLDVYSGLLLSDYPFLQEGIRYTTWHVMPPVREAVAEGRALGPTIERATSLYCADKGVGSEREWREKARAQGIPCTCMNIECPYAHVCSITITSR